MANVCTTNERAANGSKDVTEIKRPEQESNKIFNVFVADFLAGKARKKHKKLSKQKIDKEKNYKKQQQLRKVAHALKCEFGGSWRTDTIGSH